MLDAAREHELDAVVRVTGDAPLVDQRLVDEGVRTLRREGCDLVTNVRPRQLPARPIGPALSDERARGRTGRPDHARGPRARHGPLYAGAFACSVLRRSTAHRAVVALDTREDHARREAILSRLDRPHWGFGWADFL